VLKEAGEPVESAEGEQTSNASEKVGTEPQSTKDGGRAQAVQKVRDLLGRCRNYLVNVQEKEKSSQSTHRGRRELLVAQHKMVELVNKVNLLVETGEVDLSDLRFAVKRELGKQFELWSLTQPDGQKTVVWLNEAQKQLVIVGKVSRLPDNELLEVGQERLLKGNLPDVAQETNAKKTARKAKEDHGPAWGEVRDWIRSQTGSVEKRNTGRRETNDAKAKPVRDEMPISVPYTTAASTFVYGANAVLACLSAKKRKFYHLYFARSEADVDLTDTTKDQIQKLGREADIPTTYSTSKQLLAKMSDRRAHNGIALEASQISAPPVLGIGKPDMHHSIMPVQLDRQSPEEIVVNGAPTALPLITKTWRHPFVLMLDGILDEGNLGNILRTAYFYGVDAVAISKNTCASVNSPIVAKASSGAIEAVQILSLPFPSKFVYNCLRSSWRVYAAVAPPAVIPSGETGKYLTHASIASRSPLQDHACILMLGAEGEGLRGNLKTRADYFVSIEQGERAGMAGGLLPGIGVDSMNVSSAAGVLVESFMRKPQGAQLTGVGGALGF
jgi:21S rRNA (GM2251-2'-O)-methyltransferase